MSLQFLKEACGFGRNIGILRFGEFSEQIPLLGAKPRRRLDRHLDQLIARAMRSHVRQALALDPKDAAVLRPRRDPQALGSVDARHVDRRP